MEMRFMVGEDTPGGRRTETKWDAEAYARNTAHHRTHDDAFLRSIQLTDDMDLVDVGCGVGDFTGRLAQFVRRGSVMGIDPSDDLISRARHAAPPNASFVTGSAQSLTAVVDRESVHGVVSRAALHWIPESDHPQVLDEMHAVLRPGGFLRLEFGGAGNIAPTVAILADVALRHGAPSMPWYFPEAGDYRRLLEQADFDMHDGFVRLDHQRRPFDQQGFTGWLESQVLNAYERWIDPQQRDDFRADVSAITHRFENDDTGWDRHYVRMQVLAHKPR